MQPKCMSIISAAYLVLGMAAAGAAVASGLSAAIATAVAPRA